MGALRRGERRMHFENNKGYLNSSILEGVTTSQVIQDRLLGTMDIIELPNEVDFSLSANTGIRWTPDLQNRMRKINLFMETEDANKRVFERPDLDSWVTENRARINSAIVSLIKEWYAKGMPSGEKFSS